MPQTFASNNARWAFLARSTTRARKVKTDHVAPKQDSLETQSTSRSSTISNCQNHWIHQKIMLSMTFRKWFDMLTSNRFFGVKILNNGVREGNRSIG